MTIAPGDFCGPFVKLPTNLFTDDSPVPSGPATIVLTFMLARCAPVNKHVFYRGQYVELAAGQLCASRAEIAKHTGISEQRIRTALDILKKIGIINQPNNQPITNNLTLYSIDLRVFESGNQPTDQPTNNQPTTNQQPTKSPVTAEVATDLFKSNGLSDPAAARAPAHATQSLTKKERKKERVDSPPVVPPKGANTKKPNRKRSWPDDLILTDTMRAYAENQTPGVDAAADFEHWRDHSAAKGSTYIDWQAAWRNWCRSPYDKPMLNRGDQNHGRSINRSNGRPSLSRAAARLIAEGPKVGAAYCGADGNDGSPDQENGGGTAGRGHAVIDLRPSSTELPDPPDDTGDRGSDQDGSVLAAASDADQPRQRTPASEEPPEGFFEAWDQPQGQG